MAFLMAIVTVFSLIPILGGATISAAISSYKPSNSTAMSTINQRMKNGSGGTYYTPQMWRSVSRTKNSNGTYTYSSKTNGICTWCAVNNLLNRRVALENSSPTSKFFTMKETVKVLSGSSNYVEYKPNYIWIGNKDWYTDLYDNTFVNSAGISYKARHYSFASTNVEDKKIQLKKLLDEHPEGVVVQFSRTFNKGTNNERTENHGFVISGYYYSSGKLSFYAVDTGSSASYASYKDGKNTRLEDAWIGVGTKYGNNGDADKIIQGLTFYVSLVPEPISIDLTGFKGTLKAGSPYGIPGNISSNANIQTVVARIYYGQDQYQGNVASVTLTNVGKKELNTKEKIGGKYIDSISMGSLRQGDYYFEVKVTDVNGNTLTKRTPFSVR